MLSKVYLQLSFQDNSLTKQIDQFKRRFDSKMENHLDLYLPLHRPIEILTKDRIDFINSCEELAEDFFFDHNYSPSIVLKGLEILKHKKEYILFLNPSLSEDIVFFLDGLTELTKEFSHSKLNKNTHNRAMIPLGRFFNEHQLARGIELAKSEINLEDQLKVDRISLNEESLRKYYTTYNFILFNKDKKNTFLHSKISSL